MTDAVCEQVTNKIKDKKYYLKCIKVIMFVTILCILWHECFSVLWVNKNPIAYFYEEPNDSLDVVYIGSSNGYTSFNTVLAYNLYGYTTGMLSTDVQPFATIEYFIKEAEKYQNPQLYVIDIVKLVDNISSYAGEDVRRSTDSMKFSMNRIEAINETLGYMNIDKQEYINYYFSFLLYHNRWKNVSSQNFKDNSFYKGYWFHNNTTKVMQQESYIYTDEVLELPEINKQILLKLIDYIKNNNINVLFVIPIRVFDKTRNGRLNEAISIIQENKLNYINLNKLEDFTIDFSTDLYNEAHLNVYGATKYTLYFAKYLKEHYNLTDHRNDVKYESWENEYKRLEKDFKNITNQNFDDVLLAYQ